MYDGKLDCLKDEMETMYNLKVQEFRTGASRQNIDQVHTKEEITRLKTITGDLKGKLNDLEARNAHLLLEIEQLEREREERRKALEEENQDLKQQLAKMHAEQSAITQELAQISDSKLTLELEIAGYRRLLEGEENKEGLKQIVDSMYSTMMSSQERGHGGHGGEGSSGMNVSQAVRGNITAKTTYQRSAKGPVNVGDCSPEGTFITLENTSRKDEDISGWSIKRNTDGREMAGYTIPANTTIRAGEKIKIYSRGKKGGDATGLESQVDIWDTTGSIITTKFCSPQGEDRANLTQRTVFN